MSIFISHSHKDRAFVDKLGLSLVDKRIPIFVDRWEMNVGDSITNKIQDAITDSSFLMVVLSKNSVESDWCKREITTGLMLELEKKRVLVLPVLIDDCEIPLFLRDKLYADFRGNFVTGFEKIVESVSRLKNDTTGRVNNDDDNIYYDFLINWGKRGEYFELQIDIVEYSIDIEKPSTFLTNIVFVGNKEATRKFDEYVKLGRDGLMKSMLLMLCAEEENFVNANAYLFDDKLFETILELRDFKTNINFKGYVTVKRLGPSDGKSKAYYFGSIFKKLWEEDRVNP